MSVRRALVCALLLCAGSVSAADEGFADLVYHSVRAPSDARLAAMAGSGSALRSGAMSVFVNPALCHAYAKMRRVRGLLAGITYAQQEPVYDGHVVTLGGGYATGDKGTIINLYRYVQGKPDVQTDYQVVASYGGQMFQKAEKQGAVDYGVNIRYEQSNWDSYDLPELYTRRIVGGDTTFSDTSWVASNNRLEKRLAMDVGFFQADVITNLDFGLVLHNILGYRWGEERPQVVAERYLDTDTLPPDTVLVDRLYYDNQYVNTDGWIESWYRRLTVGVAFSSFVFENRIELRVPADLELIGLFEGDRDTHLMFRCGIEADILTKVQLRFGYARQPRRVERGVDPVNQHYFSGGLGVSVKWLNADLFIGKNEWGLGATVAY